MFKDHVFDRCLRLMLPICANIPQNMSQSTQILQHAKHGAIFSLRQLDFTKLNKMTEILDASRVVNQGSLSGRDNAILVLRNFVLNSHSALFDTINERISNAHDAVVCSTNHLTTS